MADARSPRLDEKALAEDVAALTQARPRAPGSDAEERAREHVAGRLEELGIAVERHEFPYLGWTLAEPPSLAVTGPDARPLDALAFTYSPSGRVEGTLDPIGEHWVVGLYRWRKFRIAASDGQTAGYVSARRDGPAVPCPLEEGASPLPHFVIGAADLDRLEAQVRAGADVRVEGEIVARLDREARGQNLAAHLPGPAPSSPRIALTAHVDTLVDGPAGARSARALAALLALARNYSTARPPVAIDLLVFTGREWDLAGSKAYVADHVTELSDLRLVMNLDAFDDSVSRLQLWTSPETLEAQLFALIPGFAPGLLCEYRSPSPPDGDHMPFAVLGIPVVTLIGDGAPAGEDRDGATLAEVTELTRRLIDELDHDASHATKRALLAPNRATPWEHSLSLKQY